MKNSSPAGGPRDAFLLAASVPEARIDGWIGAVPGLLSEAERRRAAAPVSERISAAGRYWIPRLVPLTALLVALALLWSAGGQRRTNSRNVNESSLERWLVTGSESETSVDPLVNALVGASTEDRRH